METRANHVWVGAVTLALLALLVGCTVWAVRINRGDQNFYDIYFRQSVDGLAKGSQVTYAGVPAGQIAQIELWRKDPSFVRVRVAIDHRIPILEGTTATIQGSFTGVSAIQLNGGRRDAAPIAGAGPDGVPVIPTKRSGLGELLSNAPQLLDRLTTLTERLTLLLSDKNEATFASILNNTNRITANLADASPQMKQTLSDLDGAVKQATQTLAAFQQVAGSANQLLDQNGNSLAHQLSDTLKSAQGAADALHATLDDARPATQELSQKTLPQAEQTLRELRAATKALRDITEKIDNQGVSGVIAAPKLPEYKP